MRRWLSFVYHHFVLTVVAVLALILLVVVLTRH